MLGIRRRESPKIVISSLFIIIIIIIVIIVVVVDVIGCLNPVWRRFRLGFHLDLFDSSGSSGAVSRLPHPPFPPPSPFSGHVIHLGGSRAFSGPIKLCIVQVLPSGWDSPELPADWLPSSACCHPQGQGRLQREIVTGWHHIPVWDSSRFLKHWGIVAVVWSRSPSAPAIHTGCFGESWSLGRDRRRGPVEVTFSTGYSFWGDPSRSSTRHPNGANCLTVLRSVCSAYPRFSGGFIKPWHLAVGLISISWGTCSWRFIRLSAESLEERWEMARFCWGHLQR